MLGDAGAREQIALARGADQALPVQDPHPPPPALDQLGAPQRMDRVGDRRPLHAEHFGEKILRDQERVVVVPVAHHQKPACEPLREVVRTVAAGRDHDLLEKGVDVRIHQGTEGRNIVHRFREHATREAGRRAGQLDQQTRRRHFGPEHGLKPGSAFASDGRHFDDGSVRINGDHGNYAAVGKVDVLERLIRIRQDLMTLARDPLSRRENLGADARRQGEEKPISGPFWKYGHRQVLWGRCSEDRVRGGVRPRGARGQGTPPRAAGSGSRTPAPRGMRAGQRGARTRGWLSFALTPLESSGFA